MQLNANRLDILDDPDVITFEEIIPVVNNSDVLDLTFSSNLIDQNEQRQQNIRDIFNSVRCRVVSYEIVDSL